VGGEGAGKGGTEQFLRELSFSEGSDGGGLAVSHTKKENRLHNCYLRRPQ